VVFNRFCFIIRDGLNMQRFAFAVSKNFPGVTTQPRTLLKGEVEGRRGGGRSDGGKGKKMGQGGEL
jgi:hypothetical protein